ncbi:Phage major capsid protein E [Faunimonas pinastri]|uniref:Phage major capsid protein E n=1 Tax=Faunimonas pinastri TaxID=1855383 RepID=A0A1H9QBP1_9HYPH|nr:major capsid protein [Faunimonas pinastri]SER57253.1 Phage major capsid protein E [Faunimonas pinastri]
MDNFLDIFNGDAFSVIALTDSINNQPFAPGRLGAMGLFTETGTAALSVAIEEQNGILTLVPPTPRGGPGITLDKPKRNMRKITIPHFQIDDAVMADEVQGVRAFGSTNALLGIQQFVDGRLALHAQSLDVTLEFSRMGAVMGVVAYADGTTLDLYDEFGVTAQDTVYFDLSNTTDAAGGALRKACAQVVRTISDALGFIPLTGVYAIVGDDFMDGLLANKEVRASFLNQPEARALREGYAYQSFEFGGITFENYRGAVNGTSFIEPDEAHFFPTGVPGLFRTVYGPADYEETVNTLGLPRYAKQFPMPNGKGRSLESQTNALTYCTRPKTLIKGKAGTA